MIDLMQAIGPLPRKMQCPRMHTNLHTAAGTKWTLLRTYGPFPLQVTNSMSYTDLVR